MRTEDQWASLPAIVGYHTIVESFGYAIVSHASLGDYQGDMLWLIRDKDAFGFLTCGYGSCSYCDMLESMDGDINKILAYRRTLHDSIVWLGDAGQTWEWLIARDWKGQFYGESAGVQRFVDTALPDLRPPVLSESSLLMLRNLEGDPVIIADSVQEDGYDILAAGLRNEHAKYRVLQRLRKVFVVPVIVSNEDEYDD